MTPSPRSASAPKFALVPLADLRRSQVVADPIWVAAGSCVILNGHHRVAALRRLGATRAPAWVIEYDSPDIRLERWGEGPPILKAEVELRAARGQLFPPKTTRHVLVRSLGARTTPLAELMDGPRDAARRPQPRASRSPRRGAAGPGST
jgi:hypothetical protein